MKKFFYLLSGCLAMGLVACNDSTVYEQVEKPRVIVTCDPELDDLNSLIRLVLYGPDMQLEGLIYASSQYHWKGDGKGTKWFVDGREYTRNGLNYGPMESWRWDPEERFIDDVVDAYEACYPNLKVHADYPTPAYMRSIVRFGNIEFDGDISKDSPGSDLIKEKMLDDVPGTLYVTAWGGCSTIARALKSIQEDNEGKAEWSALKEKIQKKVYLCMSGDQDDTFANYIKPNWPEIGVLNIRGGTVPLAYGAQNRVSEADKVYYSAEWLAQNISSRGPLGSMYRIWGDGKQMVKNDIMDYFGLSGYTADELREMGYVVWMPPQPKGVFLAEGDTFTYLNLLGNGLRAFQDDTYGGWGGRKQPDTEGQTSTFVLGAPDPVMPDFVPAAQNDFAERMHWCIASKFEDANHHPVIQAPLSFAGKPGETLQIKAKVTDPDKDEMTLKWWQFKVGSYQGDAAVANPAEAATTFTIPADAKPGDTIHLILEATDHGTPALTHYHRLIVSVE